jgi:hypothetical protein
MPSSAAQQARDDGIAVAVAHAERVEPAWAETAFQALSDYCRAHHGQRITTPGIRAALPGVSKPPHLRAWGGVIQRASKAGLLVKVGYDQATEPHVHCSIVTAWRIRGGEE